MVASISDLLEDPVYPPDKMEQLREMLHRQILDAVSHDLKTPLATIMGSLQIHERMYDKLTPEKRKILIATALTETHRLDNFITNILDMAKLEGGKVKAKPVTCNLSQLLGDCLIRLGPKCALCTINLPSFTEEPLIYADPMLLSRAIGLVMENAIRHGGNNAVINIEYGVNNNECFISIHDNGTGIPVGKEKEIFAKYIRFSKADRQNAGTGLGLPICRHIMQLLSGGITGKNHPKGGAVFTITFPHAGNLQPMRP